VKLLSPPATALRVISAPVPIVRFEVTPPVNEPAPYERVPALDRVRVLAPIVNTPEVRVSVPPTVTLPHKVTARLTVRLFNVTPGRLAAPAPPIIILEAAPPISVPQFIIPLSVSVFAPIDNPPPVGLKVPVIVGELCKVTKLVLVIERPFNATTVAGINTPAEVPPKTRLDAAVTTRFEGVPAMVGPFSVRVLPPTVKVPAVRVRVPFNDKAAPSIIFLLVMKLLSPPATALRVISAPVPIVRFEVTPPVNEPAP
jgi:hypothetical protein